MLFSSICFCFIVFVTDYMWLIQKSRLKPINCEYGCGNYRYDDEINRRSITEIAMFTGINPTAVKLSLYRERNCILNNYRQQIEHRYSVCDSNSRCTREQYSRPFPFLSFLSLPGGIRGVGLALLLAPPEGNSWCRLGSCPYPPRGEFAV